MVRTFKFHTAPNSLGKTDPDDLDYSHKAAENIRASWMFSLYNAPFFEAALIAVGTGE